MVWHYWFHSDIWSPNQECSLNHSNTIQKCEKPSNHVPLNINHNRTTEVAGHWISASVMLAGQALKKVPGMMYDGSVLTWGHLTSTPQSYKRWKADENWLCTFLYSLQIYINCSTVKSANLRAHSYRREEPKLMSLVQLNLMTESWLTAICAITMEIISVTTECFTITFIEWPRSFSVCIQQAQ